VIKEDLVNEADSVIKEDLVNEADSVIKEDLVNLIQPEARSRLKPDPD